jgi:hypothetical protein
MMKLNGSNVIQVTSECKKTTLEFVVPDSNFVVITSTDK